MRAGGPSTVASRAALAELCAIYRAPLLAYTCRVLKDDVRAEDMIQDFLTRMVERDVIRAADPARGRFRAFLQTSMKNHILNARETEQAQKRGGGACFVDADRVAVKSEGATPEQSYDRQCAWELLNRAYTRLRDEQLEKGHGAVFEALRERLVGDDEDGATLREVAQRLCMDTVTIRVKLSRLRKSFGELVRDEIAQTVVHPEDVDDELHELLVALRGPS